MIKVLLPKLSDKKGKGRVIQAIVKNEECLDPVNPDILVEMFKVDKSVSTNIAHYLAVWS